MANILVSMHNFARNSQNYHAMPPCYETVMEGLCGAGNRVLLVKCFAVLQ